MSKNKHVISWFLDTGESYSTEAQAVFTNIGGTLSTSVKDAIATFVDAEVAAGRWTTYLDVFQLYGTALGSEAQGLKNWISSSYTATNPNGHTAGVTGYDFSGSGTSGVSTGYNPTTGSKWTSTNAIQGVYVNRNDSTADQKILLGFTNTSNVWYQRTTSNRLDFLGTTMNGAGNAQKTTYASGWEQGLWSSKFEVLVGPAYLQRIFKNGSDLGLGSSSASVSETNATIFIGGVNSSTSPFDGVISAYYAGAGTGFDVSDFYTNFNTLITTLGVKI